MVKSTAKTTFLFWLYSLLQPYKLFFKLIWKQLLGGKLKTINSLVQFYLQQYFLVGTVFALQLNSNEKAKAIVTNLNNK